ncbi:MAG: malto-oligosyltrehalose trehalohydrolase [Parachlamydiaceae bacterium]
MGRSRYYPIGAELSDEGVDFRVWAPNLKTLSVFLEKENEAHPMNREEDGYFSLFLPGVGEGALYRFIGEGSDEKLVDPASRFQPIGSYGPSQVIKREFAWTDTQWKGCRIEGQIIYEIHIGTFTQEGTFLAALEQLEELASLGITLIELMPVSDFPGQFGWGYDGVNLFAPRHYYGKPEDLKMLIDKAHQLGIGVILDVVYNHFGPEGNQMTLFAQEYISDQHITDWGSAINFDHQHSRSFFLTNVRYWIEEYHFDGIRVDATPWLISTTPVHILADISKVAKEAGGDRSIIVIGENEEQNTHLLRDFEEGGYHFDALWNDDFHHSALVRLTGKREAYYMDYLGTPQEFISAAKYGFLYQGQYYLWHKTLRGIPYFSMKASSMITFLENHDQLANSGYGLRLHQRSDPGNYRAFVCLLLLGPGTPMLFQGQEFNSTRPFYYFADHSEELSHLVDQGRKKELSKFPRLASQAVKGSLPEPSNPLMFTNSKLNFKEREDNRQIYKLFKDLIKLRKEDPVFSQMDEVKIDGAVISENTFLIRYFGTRGDRLLIVNLGPDHYFKPAPEPLLAPDIHKKWKLVLSSEAVEYGGEGTPQIHPSNWKIIGHSAILLEAVDGKNDGKN